MTADPQRIALTSFMAEHLERAEPNLLTSIVKTVVEALMRTEADAVCGADHGTRTAERVNIRNG